MGGESPKPASTSTGAVFLSYASQDAEAAQRICDVLRAAGIEVWLDQSELRGGDAWDRQIRDRIHDCRLFIALISAHTEARDEGYFRREWKLAVDRTHDMLEKKAFLLPVAIDATPERGAAVPDKFHEVQWTRLPGGEAPPEFVVRVKGLVSPEPLTTARLPAGAASDSSPIPLTTGKPSPLRVAIPIAVAMLALAALAYLLINKPWISKPAAPPATSNATSSPGVPPDAFRPPPHSIAVLPFVNMSGDKEQEYFSEGLTEELLNSLSRINELQVAARTSSFSFQGEHPDIATVAHKLNVGAVLEGSVRRSANTVRITAQLVNGTTGFHLWSETYDRDLGDVLNLQTEIATAVAGALKVKLLGDEAAKLEIGGTHNPAAFDAYLRGSQAYLGRHTQKDLDTAISAFTEAIGLDPNYAHAYVARSVALDETKNFAGQTGDILARALADAKKAIALAPDFGQGHAALARALASSLDLTSASEEYEHALALAPGDAQVLRDYSDFAAAMGHFDAAVAAARRAVLLDPLNRDSHAALFVALAFARRIDEAKSALQDVLTLDPEYADPYTVWSFYYYLGDLQASRTWCEKRPAEWGSQLCLAIVYDKQGRHVDAQAEFAKLKASNPAADDYYQYAEIYAQWGKPLNALQSLETALRLRQVALRDLKVDPLLDPLRNEPRFQAIERELKFPQ